MASSVAKRVYNSYMRAHRRRVKAALNKMTVNDVRKFLTSKLSQIKR